MKDFLNESEKVRLFDFLCAYPCTKYLFDKHISKDDSEITKLMEERDIFIGDINSPDDKLACEGNWFLLKESDKAKNNPDFLLCCIRNAIAHGHIYENDECITLQDFDYFNSNGKQVMNARLDKQTLFDLIDIWLRSRILDE